MRHAARTKILQTVAANYVAYAQEVQLRDSLLTELSHARCDSPEPMMQGSSITPSRRHRFFDPSYIALRAVSGSVDEFTTKPVSLSSVDALPSYDTWVPVRHDFFDETQAPDPFLPYFGESRKLRKKAFAVYKQMQIDNPHAAYDISDGELDPSTNRFKSPRAYDFDDLCNRHRREAERHTILTITRRYGSDNGVLYALTKAFGKASVQVTAAILRVARDRERVNRDRVQRREKMARQTNAIACALSINDKDPDTQFNLSSSTCEAMTHSLRFFCFVCHIFCCKLHDGQNVQPITPISDIGLKRRLSRLTRSLATPCGAHCFLRDSDSSIREGAEPSWSHEEIDLLSEARMLHGDDSCSLSVVLNTRSCEEISRFLKKSIPLSESSSCQSRKSGGGCAAVTIVDLSESDNDDMDVEIEPTFVKTEPQPSGVTHTPFVPCNHKGPCNLKNGCICVKNNINCESLCGCRTGRFSVGTEGTVWTYRQGRSGGLSRCENRHGGCLCHLGKAKKCTHNSCPCFAANRACDPDVCHNCQADVLPESLSISERRCGNTDLIAGRHKKVFVGRSKVHGYGLFAGQNFEKGELIGPYCGRVMQTDAMDRELRVPQAKKSTYAFNLTHEMTIDAGLIGSKVKFINHSDDAVTINCISKMKRVRGECRIAVVSTRTIKVGEELLMNYELDQGNNWFEHEDSDSEGSNSSAPSDEAEDEPGAASWETVIVTRKPMEIDEI